MVVALPLVERRVSVEKDGVGLVQSTHEAMVSCRARVLLLEFMRAYIVGKARRASARLHKQPTHEWVHWESGGRGESNVVKGQREVKQEWERVRKG